MKWIYILDLRNIALQLAEQVNFFWLKRLSTFDTVNSACNNRWNFRGFL